MQKNLNKIGRNARKAFSKKLNNKLKNKVLKKFAKLIKINKKNILKENSKDINFARKKGLKENLIKRLELNNNKIDQIIKSVVAISKFKDPVNIIKEKWKRPNGLRIKK